MRVRAVITIGLGLLVACSSVRVTRESVTAIQASINPQSSTFEGYQLEGGAWVAGQPLLLTRDYDFSLATSGDFGPGLAAAQRVSENQRVAAALQSMDALNPGPVLDAALADCGCRCRALHGRKVRLYGVLFGEAEVRLQTVLEIELPVDRGGPLRLVVVSSEKRPLETGEASWTSEHGRPIGAALRKAVPLLVELFLLHSHELDHRAASPRAEKAECPVSATYAARGVLLARHRGQSVLLHQEMPRTLIGCKSPDAPAHSPR